MTCTDWWHWLVNYGVPRTEIDGELTKFLLPRYKQKRSISSEQKYDSNKNRDVYTVPQSIHRLETQCISPEPLEWRGDQIPFRKNSSILPKIYSINISPKEIYDISWGKPYINAGKEIIGLVGTIGHWLQTDTNSRRPRMSLWPTRQSRGLWKSNNQRTFSSVPSHGGSTGSLSPSCGYLLSCRMHNLSRHT